MASLSIAGTLALIGVAVEADDGLQKQISAAEENAVISIPAQSHKSPLSIDRPLTLKGADVNQSIIDVTANQPAVRVTGKGPVVLENLTIKWQLASSDGQGAEASALFAKDGELTLKNCRVIALGNGQRCPSAVSASGFSKVTLEDCQIEGFEFAINYSGGAEGAIRNCVIANPGHCGATVFSGSTMEVAGCLITGSKYHGLRCTGGTMNAHDNLIIANKNRGIYLGNKPAAGKVRNNVIANNGTGISAFGSSEVTIESNLLLKNDFAGVDFRDSCPLTIDRNIFQENGHGVVQFADSGRSRTELGSNCFWKNDTTAKDIELPEPTLQINPDLADPEAGDFTRRSDEVKSSGIGPETNEAFAKLWKRWKQMQQ